MFISSENVIFEMSKDNKPALTAKSGDTVIFDALDCFSNTVKTEEDTVSTIDFSQVNPATGPLFIEGAEPGDTLKVTIHTIEMDNQGVMVAAPGLGQFGDDISKEETLIAKVIGNSVEFNGLNIPMNKMVGVIGTAPEGEPVNTGTPGDHGGNLDTTLITEGSSIYLPVNTEGALLAMGDCHAAMGDGEIMGTGVEIPAEVTVTVEVLKDCNYPLPLVETDKVVATLGSRDTMEASTKLALENMKQYIKDHSDFNDNQVGMFMSAVANVKACQLVNPRYTMRVEVPKNLLNK